MAANLQHAHKAPRIGYTYSGFWGLCVRVEDLQPYPKIVKKRCAMRKIKLTMLIEKMEGFNESEMLVSRPAKSAKSVSWITWIMTEVKYMDHHNLDVHPIWFIRHMPKEGKHSLEAIELVKEFVVKLENIEEGIQRNCAWSEWADGLRRKLVLKTDPQRRGSLGIAFAADRKSVV